MGSDSGDVRRDLFPPGEVLQRAVRWISQQRQERPAVPLAKLVDEASLQFDLTPLQSEGLLRTLVGPP
jgi:hypothetical protein